MRRDARAPSLSRLCVSERENAAAVDGAEITAGQVLRDGLQGMESKKKELLRCVFLKPFFFFATMMCDVRFSTDFWNPMSSFFEYRGFRY